MKMGQSHWQPPKESKMVHCQDQQPCKVSGYVRLPQGECGLDGLEMAFLQE